MISGEPKLYLDVTNCTPITNTQQCPRFDYFLSHLIFLILNHTFNYKIFRTLISFFTRNLLICSALREKILIYEILKTQQPYFNLLFSFENWPLCNSYLQRWICKFYYYSKHISSAGKQSIYFSLTIQPIISLSIQLAA